MDQRTYVATDTAGIERRDGVELQWDLPEASGRPGSAIGKPVLIYNAAGLLDHLDEVISVAEAIGTASPEADGALKVDDARLTGPTPWNAELAARFALDCAQHVLGDAGDVALPNGAVLADVVADARRYLDGSDEPEGRLAWLSRLNAARRLRASGTRVGDAARSVLVEDLAAELDAAEDPAWSLLASVADAVLAAVEALRHVALPRYANGREQLAGERDAHAGEAVVPSLFVTAWGPVEFGAEHESAYMPASHLAREASFRARETARQRDPAELQAETAWQADTLEKLLGS